MNRLDDFAVNDLRAWSDSDSCRMVHEYIAVAKMINHIATARKSLVSIRICMAGERFRRDSSSLNFQKFKQNFLKRGAL